MKRGLLKVLMTGLTIFLVSCGGNKDESNKRLSHKRM